MLVFALLVLSLAYAHGLQVNTTEGVVQGSKAADGDYYVFYGVPYAGPTSGQNRFKGPVAPARRPNVLKAIESNVICAQPTSRGLIGSEDCLVLNVFTKNATNSTKPVIVWLNSEEYTTSYTQMFSFRKFVEEDVVFVSLNFRLSIFGFLCLGVQEAPGNAGLKDVVQGLKWIQANIANFGGDPKNVILMGHASGAAMVDLLTLSSQTDNLVHKAIALSGSGLAPWAVAYNPVGYAKMLGDRLGYTGKTQTDLAKHLITTDITVLHTALSDIKFQNNTPLFAPCVENPKLKRNDTVITEAPINVLRSGKYTQIPFIYGYTTREGTMRAEEAAFGTWLNAMQTNFTNFLPVDLEFGKNKTAVAKDIRDFYFSTKPISMETIEDFMDYQGDTLVVISVIKGAKERAFTSKNDVLLLEFGYMGTLNSDWVYNQISLHGAKHGAFMNYLFDYDLRPADEAVSRSIVKRFTGFAHNWNSVAATTARNASTWTPITKDTTNYLYYGGNEGPRANNTAIYVEEPRFDPHVQRVTFWKNLYAKYYVAPSPTNSSIVTLSSVFFVMLCQLLVRMF